MDFREKTGISFGLIEAYARRHLRIAPLIGTSIRLSLQEGSTRPASPSPLRSLIDDTTLTLAALRGLVPSLHSATWSFRAASDSAIYELTTVADGVCVALSVDDPMDESTQLVLEGTLRGMAARLVVALEYGI
ncbi:hypothetical protein [Paraburkholderia phenazinium]|uniref:hypothetical protein n=1 Tax=Paraburkholderia phenazinium TaxID=60549 RepID=UPI001589BD20|nr:hypothetical protein [Paraburkholderia phenazinium]